MALRSLAVSVCWIFHELASPLAEVIRSPFSPTMTKSKPALKIALETVCDAGADNVTLEPLIS